MGRPSTSPPGRIGLIIKVVLAVAVLGVLMWAVLTAPSQETRPDMPPTRSEVDDLRQEVRDLRLEVSALREQVCVVEEECS